MRVTFTVTAGPHIGRQFVFSEHETFIVGRSNKAQFQLPVKDKYFSRLHFLVEVNPPLCRLLDLESRNGTYVNRKKVAGDKVELKNGDRIKGGETVLTVAIEYAPDEVPSMKDLPAPSRTSQRRTVIVPQDPDDPYATEPRAPSDPPQNLNERPGRLDLQPVRVSATPQEICVAQKWEALLPPDYRDRIRQHGQPIKGYQIVDELGRGAMGVVYRAIRNADQSVVAVKTVLPVVRGIPRDYEMFLREAEILKSLNHPHIVRFLEMGTTGALLFFAMEYVPGTDASKLVPATGASLPVPRIVNIIDQLLSALEEVHVRGFVHRDIKPSNLMVQTMPSGDDFARLADFGLARAYQSSRLSGLTVTGGFGGTMAFMAPEQMTDFRHAKPHVDQYSVAASLYYMLTRRCVYRLPKTVARQILMLQQEPFIPITEYRSDLPPGLVEAIHRGLAREPGDRFPSVSEFRAALRPFGKSPRPASRQ